MEGISNEKIITLILCGALTSYASGQMDDRANLQWDKAIQSKESEPLIVDIADLTRTIINSNIDAIINSGRNYIFNCSLNLAWNELVYLLQSASVDADPSNALIDCLNGREFDKSMIAEEDYFAKAEYLEPDSIIALDKELHDKFPKAIK